MFLFEFRASIFVFFIFFNRGDVIVIFIAESERHDAIAVIFFSSLSFLTTKRGDCYVITEYHQCFSWRISRLQVGNLISNMENHSISLFRFQCYDTIIYG